MVENKTVRIGSELLALEKVSYKVFRKINPRKNGKYLCYFSPGEGYFRIKRENSLPALKKQLDMFLEERTVYSEDDFVKDISFLPIYFYNNLLFFDAKDIPHDLKIWQNTLKLYTEGKEIPSFAFLLMLGPIKGWKNPGLTGRGLDFLNYWLLKVIQHKVKVKVCSADDCKRLYIESKGDQKYCSEQCLQRSSKRRKKSRRKTLIESS